MTPTNVRGLLAGLPPAMALQAAVVARAASENVEAAVGKPRVSKRPTEVWNADRLVSVSGRPCGIASVGLRGDMYEEEVKTNAGRRLPGDVAASGGTRNVPLLHGPTDAKFTRTLRERATV